MESLSVSSTATAVHSRDPIKIHVIGLMIFGVVFGGLGIKFLHPSSALVQNVQYVSTSGSDAHTCSNATTDACLTFDRAYHNAQPGAIVEVEAGTYDAPFVTAASQTVDGELITWDAAKDNVTADVIFRPAVGATVNVAGNIRVYGSHVIFQNMQVSHDVEAFNFDPNGVSAGHNVGFISFQNIVARNFQIAATHDVNILGGSYGPSSSCQSAQPNLPQYGGANNAVRPQQGVPDPVNVMIDGVTIHNTMSYDLVGCHTEGIAIFSGSNVTIRNSKFYGNDIYNMLLQSNSGSGPLGAVAIENNWFAGTTNSAGTGSGNWALDIETGDNLMFRHNSFNQSVVFERLTSFSNTSIIGNLGGGIVYAGTSNSSLCGMPGVVALYNIIQRASGLSCTTPHNTDLGTAPPPFVRATNDSTMDYRLMAGSAAQDYVPLAANASIGYAGDPLVIDFEYHCRPIGAANDAGASEFGSTAACGTASAVPNGASNVPTAAKANSSTTTTTSPHSAPGSSVRSMNSVPTVNGIKGSSVQPQASQQSSVTSPFVYTAVIRIVEKNGTLIRKATVTLAGQIKNTNENGMVMFSGLGAGQQKVMINVRGKSTQSFITLGSSRPDKSSFGPEQFTLTAAKAGSQDKPAVIGSLLILLMAVPLFLFRVPLMARVKRPTVRTSPLAVNTTARVGVLDQSIASVPGQVQPGQRAPEPGSIVQPDNLRIK